MSIRISPRTVWRGLTCFSNAPGYGRNGKIEDALKKILTVKAVRLAAKKKVVIIPTNQWSRISTIDQTSDGSEFAIPATGSCAKRIA